MALYGEITAFSRFLRGLPAFVRGRLSLQEAQAIIAHRMRSRESNLLTVFRQSVVSNPRSPYREMLRLAQCEMGDLERMITRDGVEAALRELRAAGVYVSFEEFKGQAPIVRHGTEIRARFEDFDNPHLTDFHAVGTGGSTGTSRRVLLDLDHLRSRLAHARVSEDVHGVFGIPTAYWFEIPPGHGLDAVLQRIPLGNVPERWFSPVSLLRDGGGGRFGLATAAIIATARIAGARLPFPEHVPLDRADVIADWMGETLARTGQCLLRAHVSKGLRVALAATKKGIDLTGAVISGGGEPPSPAKVAGIHASGARYLSNYFFMELGPVGHSCTATTDPNDQHVLLDHVALIQVPRVVAGFPVEVDAFNFTTLLPTAPKVLINVESDDFGVVEDRACGCGFESYGFTRHVRDIRSFRKLTGEGVTLLGSDMERILEAVLPARFGGSHLDYQLVEEEDASGFTRLTLVVDPKVAIANDEHVVSAVLDALGRIGGAAAGSRQLWTQAATLRVRREAPTTTARGKWLPLRVERNALRAIPAQVPR